MINNSNFSHLDMLDLQDLTIQHKILLSQSLLLQLFQKKESLKSFKKYNEQMVFKLLSLLDENHENNFYEELISVSDVLPSSYQTKLQLIKELNLFNVESWEYNVYGLNLSNLYTYFHDIKNDNANTLNEEITFEDSIAFLTSFNTEELNILLSNDYNNIKKIIISHIVFIVNKYYSENVSKDIINNMYELLKDRISQESWYNLSSKTKHYIWSVNKLKKVIDENFFWLNSWIHLLLEEYINKHQTYFNHDNKLESLVSFVPFLLVFVQEKLWKIIYGSVFNERKKIISDEVDKKQQKNNIPKKNDAQLKEDSKVFDLNDKKESLIQLSPDEKDFIDNVIVLIKEDLDTDKQSTLSQLESYLSRMIKNKKDIRLIDRLDSNDDIIVTQELYDKIVLLFENYNRKEQSISYNHSNFDEIKFIENSSDDKIEEDEDKNINESWNNWHVPFDQLHNAQKTCMKILNSQWFTSHTDEFIIEYQNLALDDKKSLYDKLRLASSHAKYREVRPNWYKIIKFGISRRLRLLAHWKNILWIKSKSGNYDSLINKLYNRS